MYIATINHITNVNAKQRKSKMRLSMRQERSPNMILGNDMRIRINTDIELMLTHLRLVKRIETKIKLSE